MEKKTVMVTGGAGYIGSILVRNLLDSGYRVFVFDKIMFGLDPIKDLLTNDDFKLIIGDIDKDTDLEKIFDEEFDDIIHLAAIVGDPACADEEEAAVKTNFTSTVKLANLCKERNVKKFIFASTCSVYGANDDRIIYEDSKLNPVSLYAETRLYAERAITALKNHNFFPVLLRFGTVYGLSPRPRFDLVVNFLTKKAVIDKKISIFGGNQWRPFIHVSDISSAIQLVLESPEEKTNGEIFNIGNTKENYQMSQIGESVKKVIPGIVVEVIEEFKDNRSYHVNFDKVTDILGFKTKKSLIDGIKEMKEVIESGEIDPDDNKYYNHRSQN